MSAPVRLLVLLLLGAGLIGVVAQATPGAAVVVPRGFPVPSPESRARPLTFVGVAQADEQVVLAALAAARPEARRLVDAVAGLTTVRVGDAGPDASGYARASVEGYAVVLDLGTTSRVLGARGVQRLVLHELGHVVRRALVSPALLAELDAGIPPGYGCEDGRLGSCAPEEERFAESFAKWALGDIGVGLESGYKVPPPRLGLDAWAQPLTSLPLGS